MLMRILLRLAKLLLLVDAPGSHTPGARGCSSRPASILLVKPNLQANSGAAPPPYQPPSPTAGMAIPAQYATEAPGGQPEMDNEPFPAIDM